MFSQKGNDMHSEDAAAKIGWKEWSEDTFNKAKNEGKLVLLDLTASWCHWCHVMDKTTYSDPEIIRTINATFIPVRVDIDRRPDISERYNRGGFPTTAFLSDRGEAIWGATYVPPSDMKRVINSIIEASRSGEISEALERSRMHYLDISAAMEPKEPVSSSEVDSVFEDIFSTYDVENGGFGLAPKFPHPAVLELLMVEYVRNRDEEIAEAIVNTLQKMSEGLYDPVEGGLFRYSVSGDWHSPHYEKLLETNLVYLNNLVHAFVLFGKPEFEAWARGTAKYLLDTLADSDSGGFYGSQDADEEYYRLSKDERYGRKAPAVDRTKYAGWNLEAASVLVNSGKILEDDRILKAGIGAWEYSLDKLWDPAKGLVRHNESEDLYILEDQVALLSAIVGMLDVLVEDSAKTLAQRLIEGVDRAFSNEDGGYSDIERKPDAIGDLDDPRRPLTENSNWARALGLFGMAARQYELVDKAKTILESFKKKEIDSSGLFSAGYVIARRVLDSGPLTFEVHSARTEENSASKMTRAGRMAFNPGIAVRLVEDKEASTPYAVICSRKGCLQRIDDPSKIDEILSSALADRRN